MINESPVYNLEEIDSTLSSDEITQKLSVETKYKKPKKHITFIEYLLVNDIICKKEKETIYLKLKVDNPPDENEHSVTDYTTPIATGVFSYDRCCNVAYIGSVFVDENLQKMGIGTQIKQQMENMIRQKGVRESYTMVVSNQGKKLAKKTGYSIFDEYDGKKILKKTY